MTHVQIMRAAVQVAGWPEKDLEAVLELAKILRTCEQPPKRKYVRRQPTQDAIEAVSSGGIPEERAPRRRREPKVDPNVTVRMPEVD